MQTPPNNWLGDAEDFFTKDKDYRLLKSYLDDDTMILYELRDLALLVRELPDIDKYLARRLSSTNDEVLSQKHFHAANKIYTYLKTVDEKSLFNPLVDVTD